MINKQQKIIKDVIYTRNNTRKRRARCLKRYEHSYENTGSMPRHRSLRSHWLAHLCLLHRSNAFAQGQTRHHLRPNVDRSWIVSRVQRRVQSSPCNDNKARWAIRHAHDRINAFLIEK